MGEILYFIVKWRVFFAEIPSILGFVARPNREIFLSLRMLRLPNEMVSIDTRDLA